MTKATILKFLRENFDLLKSKYAVKKIGLFGSYVKNEATKSSDIDIYVELDKKGIDNMTGLWIYLENSLGKKVDIVFYHPKIRREFKKSIDKEIIYA